MQTTFIYGLVDPRTQAIRYIGKADQPRTRLVQHIHDSKRRRNHCATWVRSLQSNGLRPTLQIVDEVAMAEWKAVEAAYIQFYREEGCDLTNLTQGGDGALSGKDNPWYGKGPFLGKKHSAEARARMGTRGESHPQFGKPLSPEVRAKLSAARTGTKASPESVAKRMAKLRGKNPMLGKKHSVETRAKISAALRSLRNPCRGETHYNSKLTEAQVRDILAAPSGSMRMATTLGISYSALKRIRARKLWTHVHAHV